MVDVAMAVAVAVAVALAVEATVVAVVAVVVAVAVAVAVVAEKTAVVGMAELVKISISSCSSSDSLSEESSQMSFGICFWSSGALRRLS